MRELYTSYEKKKKKELEELQTIGKKPEEIPRPNATLEALNRVGQVTTQLFKGNYIVAFKGVGQVTPMAMCEPYQYQLLIPRKFDKLSTNYS